MRFGKPPAPPFRRGFWRSPLRGPWLTAVFGSILLVGIPIVFVTGLLSYAAYNPGLARQRPHPGKGRCSDSSCSTGRPHPHWLYRVTQGIHVTLGLVLIPVLLGQVVVGHPEAVHWPPVTSPAQAAGAPVAAPARRRRGLRVRHRHPEHPVLVRHSRARSTRCTSTARGCSSAPSSSHVGNQVPEDGRALRARRLRDELRVDLAHTEPEPPDDGTTWSARNRRPATISRRGVLGLVGASSLTIFALTVGQSIGGWPGATALLAPR